MREILFRGKRKDNGEWVYGYLFVLGEGAEYEETYILGDLDHRESIYDAWKCAERVDPETVCQSTGLVDKNGKKIFEGDVFAYRYNSRRGKEIVSYYAVTYDDETGLWQPFGNDGCGFNARKVEIIGNIHDKS